MEKFYLEKPTLKRKEDALAYINELLNNNYDYIIDAIDNVTAKIDLAIKSQELEIPMIASMGTGNKLDPTALTVTDIKKTSGCPLARVMRKELKAKGVRIINEPSEANSDEVLVIRSPLPNISTK